MFISLVAQIVPALAILFQVVMFILIYFGSVSNFLFFKEVSYFLAPQDTPGSSCIVQILKFVYSILIRF